jgi:hypothetical protein
MATFGKTTVLEKLIKHRGPLKESTTGTCIDIGQPLTQDHHR